MSETDEQFVERLMWNDLMLEKVSRDEWSRLFALARRGAAAIAYDQSKKELPHQDRRFNNAERLFGDE